MKIQMCTKVLTTKMFTFMHSYAEKILGKAKVDEICKTNNLLHRVTTVSPRLSKSLLPLPKHGVVCYKWLADQNIFNPPNPLQLHPSEWENL